MSLGGIAMKDGIALAGAFINQTRFCQWAGRGCCVKTGDNEKGIGLDEKKEGVGKFLRPQPEPEAPASYQSCAAMSSARAASVKRTDHTTSNAVRVLP